MSHDYYELDDESDIQVDHGIKVAESLEHRNVSATPNLPGLIQLTWRSMLNGEKWLMLVTVMKTRRNK